MYPIGQVQSSTANVFCRFEDCCSNLICGEGFGPGPECLLNSDNCLEPANECYSNEECCSGDCWQIAIGGGICM